MQVNPLVSFIEPKHSCCSGLTALWLEAGSSYTFAAALFEFIGPTDSVYSYSFSDGQPGSPSTSCAQFIGANVILLPIRAVNVSVASYSVPGYYTPLLNVYRGPSCTNLVASDTMTVTVS